MVTLLGYLLSGPGPLETFPFPQMLGVPVRSFQVTVKGTKMGHGACPSENQLREVAKVPVGIRGKSGSLWRGVAKKRKLCFWNQELVALELNIPWGRPRNLTQADRNHRTPYMNLTGKKFLAEIKKP